MRILIFICLFFLNCNNQKNIGRNWNDLPQNIQQEVVNDYSEILTDEEELSLQKKLTDYEAQTTNEIAIVTTDSITPYMNIQKYATDLANHWGVGQKDKDNGLMIVLSKPLRQVGIATGLGTEKILTDSICKQVIETTMIPHFKEDRYYEGISEGLDSLIYKWNRPKRF